MSVTITTVCSWPSDLPLPKLEYDGAASVSTIFSPGFSAKTQRRSRWNAPYATISVSWCFTPAQFDTFLTFWSDTLSNGAARFEIDLRYPKESALDKWIVMFVGDIEVNDIENGIQGVSTSLQLVSKTTLPDAAALV